MNTCSLEQTPVSAAQELMTYRSISRIVSDLQQTRELPKHTKIIIVPGIPAAVMKDGTLTTIMISPAEMSCLTPIEQKAVLLHEVGHLQKPVQVDLPDLASAMLVATIGGVMAARFSRDICRLIETAKGLPAWKPSKAFKQSWGRRAFIAWTLYGAGYASYLSTYEKKADLYAAGKLRTGQPLANGLIALFRTRSDLTSSLPVDQERSFISDFGHGLVRFGPVGIWMTHPSTADRVAYLRAYRPPYRPRATSVAYPSKPS